MQCYTTHRDELAFPKPETWNPGRWLDHKKDIGVDSERAKELFMPFSRGPRACAGKALAITELKVTTAALVMRARCQLGPATTEEGMKMIDHFLAMPKAGKCELLFEEL